MINYKGSDYRCAMELSLHLIGGKWKSLILLDLSERTLRFNELRREIPQATQRMLTLQLRELEDDGLIARKIYPQIPPKVEYSLTNSGREVIPVLESLCVWGDAFAKKRTQESAKPK